MKKIFIYAYTDLNLGDDLFVKILCDRYPQHQFYIVCPKSNSKPFLRITNLNVIYSISYVDRVLHKFKIHQLLTSYISKQCDAVVNIGGSIFMEPPSWKNLISRYKKIVNVGKPFFILGSNFGPYKEDEFHLEFKKIFERTTDICFREEYSYNLFEDLPNVRFAPDVVLTLNHDTVSKDHQSSSIIFSVIDLTKREDLAQYTDAYEKKISETVNLLIQKGYRITFMGFCENQGDDKAIERIKALVSKEYESSMNTYIYDGNLNKALEKLKGAKGIVGTRFHSIILGWLFDVAVYPIVYSSKTSNVLKDTHYEGEATWIKDISGVNPMTIVSQVTEENNHKIDIEIKRAQEQFFKLDSFLQE